MRSAILGNYLKQLCDLLSTPHPDFTIILQSFDDNCILISSSAVLACSSLWGSLPPPPPPCELWKWTDYLLCQVKMPQKGMKEVNWSIVGFEFPLTGFGVLLVLSTDERRLLNSFLKHTVWPNDNCSFWKIPGPASLVRRSWIMMSCIASWSEIFEKCHLP